MCVEPVSCLVIDSIFSTRKCFNICVHVSFFQWNVEKYHVFFSFLFDSRFMHKMLTCQNEKKTKKKFQEEPKTKKEKLATIRLNRFTHIYFQFLFIVLLLLFPSVFYIFAYDVHVEYWYRLRLNSIYVRSYFLSHTNQVSAMARVWSLLISIVFNAREYLKEQNIF